MQTYQQNLFFWVKMKSARFTSLLLCLIGTGLGQDCKGLFELYNDKCEYCSHPDNKSIHYERRNWTSKKCSYIGRLIYQLYANSNKYLLQNCMTRVSSSCWIPIG